MTPRPSSHVQLVASGIQLSRWVSYQVESDLFKPADAFALSAANPGGELCGKIEKEAAVRVIVEGELVCTGNVDEVTASCGNDGPTMEIIGRDRGRFLEDCSAKPESLKNQTLLTLAKRLTADWIPRWSLSGPDVVLPTIADVKIDPGESILDVLNRYAQRARVIIWLTEDGVGVIGKPDYRQAPEFALYRYASSSRRWRNNILRGGVTESSRERYSVTTVLGARGNAKSIYASSSSKMNSVVTDSEVRDKPRIMTLAAKTPAEVQSQAQELRDRGRFEGWRAEYTVARHGQDGNLWRAGAICKLVDELAGVDGETCIVTKRRFTLGAHEGEATELTLHKVGVWP